MPQKTSTNENAGSSIQAFKYTPRNSTRRCISFEKVLRTKISKGTPTKANRNFFIHIGKAGGNYLSNILCSHFPWVHIRRYDGMLGDPTPTIEGVEFVHGHFGLGDPVFLLPDTPYICMTLLRHPVERMISAYRFHERRKEQSYHNQIQSGAMSVVDFAENVCDHDGFQYSYFGYDRREALHDPHACLRNLIDQVSLFGFTHEMVDFLIMATLLLGYHKVFDPFRINATKDIQAPPEHISASTTQAELEDLHRILAVDLEFYSAAIEIYERRKQTIQNMIGTETVDRAHAVFREVIKRQCDYVDLLGISESMSSSASLFGNK